MANWQRGDPKKRGNPPEPMRFPKEARTTLTTEQQKARKKKFLERKAV